MPLQENVPCGILVKTTLIDYPGRTACTIFLPGCNLRCPYCYNHLLAQGKLPADNAVTINELSAHLEKRKNVLSGLVISGGEPLLSPKLNDIIKSAKEYGYKIKLDTNGTLPEKLSDLINNPETRPDFIAMDIKTNPEHYSRLLTEKNACPTENKILSEKVKESIKIIASYPADSREFRTVLVPELISKNDIEIIAELLPYDAAWKFAEFNNNDCLNPKLNGSKTYSQEEIKILMEYAKTLIPGAELR